MFSNFGSAKPLSLVTVAWYIERSTSGMQHRIDEDLEVSDI